MTHNLRLKSRLTTSFILKSPLAQSMYQKGTVFSQHFLSFNSFMSYKIWIIITHKKNDNATPCFYSVNYCTFISGCHCKSFIKQVLKQEHTRIFNNWLTIFCFRPMWNNNHFSRLSKTRTEPDECNRRTWPL